MITVRRVLALAFGPLAPLAPAAAEPSVIPSYVAHLELAETTLVVTEAVGGLDVPWDVAAAPDGSIWFTQHEGTVSRFDPDTGAAQQLLEVPGVYHKKSLGLLGMGLHPDFDRKPYVFLHYTYREEGVDKLETIKSRLVRYSYIGGALVDPVIVLDEIPGKSYHNGSRVLVAPDDTVLLSTGDAGDPPASLDPAQLSGKILRLNLDGSVPQDNPDPTSLVWSIGHRNVQGLALDGEGRLYASEHGPNNDDEINLIRRGGNYGWPTVEGFADLPSEKAYTEDRPHEEPLIAWTPTIAAAGLAYFDHARIPEWRNSLALVNLKGRALRILELSEDGRSVEKERIYFQKRFGRMRDVCVAPNGDIYLATSNLDWHPRYQPWMYDSLPEGGDRLLRLRAADAAMLAKLERMEAALALREDPKPMDLLAEDWGFEATRDDISKGESLYMIHCAACHRPDGSGMPGLIPPLAGTEWVTGDKSRLIQIVLKGMSDPIVVNGETYDQEMPGFATRSDEEIADILTYIRNAFGNQANAVIPGEVYEERKAL